MCVNVQSLVSNFNQIELLLTENRPYLLVCTEARTTNDIHDCEINVYGYKLIRSDSLSRHSGGVVMYVRDDVIFQKLNEYAVDYDNILVVDLLNSPYRGIWMGVYHSPNGSDSNFIEQFEVMLEEVSTLNRPIHSTGDFNINVHDNNLTVTYKQRLRNIERLFSIKQLVKTFTRVTATSRTIVDLMFTNNQSIKVSVTDVNCIADHRMLVICKKSNRKDYEHREIIDRSGLTSESFRNLFQQNFSPNYDINDIQIAAKQLTDALDMSAMSLVRKKNICVSYSKRWFGAELRELRTRRNDANRRATILNDDASWQEYRRVRNEYNRKLKENKDQDLRSLIVEAQSDQKKLWRHLKSFIDNRDKLPDCVAFNDVILTDSRMIANKLNEFFKNSIDELKVTIPHIPYLSDITERQIRPWSTFGRMSEATVHRLLNNFKSKSGINNVNKQVLMDAMYVYPQDIVNVFNKSLDSGIFPGEWKFTIVTPIPKIKGTVKPEELRPINSCHIIDKTIQSHVKEELERHIAANNLLDSNQSAYRAKHSCETALNLVSIQMNGSTNAIAKR